MCKSKSKCECNCDTTVCRCIGNTECPICYLAMTTEFDSQYQSLKAIGMEDILEAKEFMWEFYAERDRNNIKILTEEIDDTKEFPAEIYNLGESWKI